MSITVLLIIAKIVLGALPLVRWVFNQIDRAQLTALIRAEQTADDLAFIYGRVQEAEQARAAAAAQTPEERERNARARGEVRDD